MLDLCRALRYAKNSHEFTRAAPRRPLRTSAPWSARAKPQAWRSMCGWASKGREAAALYFRRARFTVDRCNGCRCSLTKNALPVGFILARSFSHALTARSSSPRRGCVVDSPPFNRATCNTRLSVSTWSSFIRQASDTRKPCRNIRSKRQRSRASFRLPLVASISRSTSRPVKCFRSLSSAPRVSAFAPVHHFVESFPDTKAPETRINRGRGFFDYLQNEAFCRRSASVREKSGLDRLKLVGGTYSHPLWRLRVLLDNRHCLRLKARARLLRSWLSLPC